MSTYSGFSDVDNSGNADHLADYLADMAKKFGERRRALYAGLNLRPGEAVLDVGCGLGEVCLDLRDLVGEAGRVVGIDLSADLIARARLSEGAERAHFDSGSVYQLPYGDNEFDVVRAERVFQHLDDPARALGEMKRVLKPGGRAYVLDANHAQWDVALEGRVVDRLRRWLSESQVKRPRAGLLAQTWMHDAGFDPVTFEAFVRPSRFETARAALGIDELLAALVRAGELTADEADEWIAEAAARPDSATMFLFYATTGIKP